MACVALLSTFGMGTGPGASPGGPSVSSIKKRRLAALNAALNEAHLEKPKTESSGHLLPKWGSKGRVHNQPATTSSTKAAKVQAYPYELLPAHIVSSALGKSLIYNTADRDLQQHKRGIENFLEDALTTAAVSDVARVIKTRIHGQTLLLDNPSKEPNAAAALKRSVAAPGCRMLMSRRQKKLLLGGPRVLMTGMKYQSDLVPANQRWLQYVQQLLASGDALEERLLQAELTGCELQVEHCRQKALEGIEGIVALSSLSAFHLVTRQDQHVVIPKEGCIVKVALGGGRSATLVGSNLLAAVLRKQPAPIPCLTTKQDDSDHLR